MRGIGNKLEFVTLSIKMINIYEFIREINPGIIGKFENRHKEKFEVILYGAGAVGKDFLDRYDLSDINVVYYCDDDRNKWGKYLNGTLIISPEELLNISSDIPVCVSINEPDAPARKLLKAGIKNLLHRYSLYYLLNIDKLQKVYDLLFDNSSRKVFLGLIEYVYTQDPDIFGRITTSTEQYFLDEIFSFEDDECIIDGGAYTGDTIQSYLDICRGSYGKIYSFEPDKGNFEKLRSTLMELGDAAKGIEIYNKDIYSSSGAVGFSNNDSFNSCIMESSPSKIEVIAIDNLFIDERITMIKLDIEGAETDAILGAEKILKMQKPKLAICNYHLPSDLWTVILQINEFVPEYKFFLRHHNIHSWYESVLYARL